MTPLEILQKTAETVAERGACYGESDESLKTIANYWRLYFNTKQSPHMLDARDVAIMMLLLKIARSGASPDHRDHYIDMAGYAALAGNLANAKNTKD